ncbi:MAG TPA: hypothetical protein GXX49_06435 [Clostridiaceae bacterium]|nr:hypothetical protein [Clostridiaceae bacterium]
MLKKIPLYILIIFTLLIFLFTGCSQNKQNPEMQRQSAKDSGENEDPPEQLKEIEKKIEKMFKDLTSLAKGGGNVQQGQNQAQEQGQKEQGQEQQGQKSEQEQGQGQGQDQGHGQKDQQGQEQQVQDPWKEISAGIHEIHVQWNSLIPVAAKKGASNKLIEDFSNALNDLTVKTAERNLEESLIFCSRFYSFIPDFYSLYKTKVSPEIKRIRHFSRNAVLLAGKGDWGQASLDVSSAKASWSLFKNSIKPEQQESANKIDYSIYEFEKVVNDKNLLLTEIKGNILLDNLENLEKEMEKNI